MWSELGPALCGEVGTGRGSGSPPPCWLHAPGHNPVVLQGPRQREGAEGTKSRRLLLQPPRWAWGRGGHGLGRPVPAPPGRGPASPGPQARPVRITLGGLVILSLAAWWCRAEDDDEWRK